ncbi:MAG: hypothetical protein ACRBG0_21650 [Lewinella sp.]|uniref:hypothetical protein n=1 Tax=Lewinella sp. TaxID=2004506 RepID=UPI003D6BA204
MTPLKIFKVSIPAVAIVAMLASIFFTSCNDTVLGDDLGSVVPETTVFVDPPIHHVVIESIEILEIPSRNPSGNHWDIFGSSGDGPDLTIQLRPVGEDIIGISEILINSSNEEYDDYQANTPAGTCYSQLTGALLSEGDLPFYVPVSFQGFLEVLDQDYFGLFGGGAINILMTSIQFTPLDYIDGTPHSILLTSVSDCRYSLRLQVRWI